MYEQEIYKDKNEKRIEEDLVRQGWRPIIVSHEAGYKYEPHQHSAEKLLVMLRGSMKVRAGEQTHTMRPGDKFVIAGNIEHEATCGAKGCEFFWAER